MSEIYKVTLEGTTDPDDGGNWYVEFGDCVEQTPQGQFLVKGSDLQQVFTESVDDFFDQIKEDFIDSITYGDLNILRVSMDPADLDARKEEDEDFNPAECEGFPVTAQWKGEVMVELKGEAALLAMFKAYLGFAAEAMSEQTGTQMTVISYDRQRGPETSETIAEQAHRLIEDIRRRDAARGCGLTEPVAVMPAQAMPVAVAEEPETGSANDILYGSLV